MKHITDKLNSCIWMYIKQDKVFNDLVWYFKLWEKNNHENKWIMRTRTLAWILYKNKEKKYKNNFLDKKSSTGTLAPPDIVTVTYCYCKIKPVILNCLTYGTCKTETGNMYKTVEIQKQFLTAPSYRVNTTQSYKKRSYDTLYIFYFQNIHFLYRTW